MWQVYYSVMQSLDHFSRREWLAVLAVVVVIGFFCMRGFGSRTTY